MRKLLRPRFSVLALMAIVAIVALVLGLVVEPYRAQSRASAELRAKGYAVEVEPTWLSRRTGRPMFDDVTVAYLHWRLEAPSVADLQLLKKLPQLRDLYVSQLDDEKLAQLDDLTG